MKNFDILDNTAYAMNIINSMIDSLVVLNPDATIMAANHTTEKLLGYGKGELQGKPVGTIIDDEELSFFKMIRDLIAKGSVYNYSMIYRTKEGKRIPVVFCGSVLQNEEQDIVGVVGVARDVRETKRLIAELETAKSSLEEKVKEKTKDLRAEKEKTEEAYNKLKFTQAQLLQQEKMSCIGQLAAGVAHEINNPIGFINSNLGTLGEYVEDMITLFTRYEKLNKSVQSFKDKEVESIVEEVEKAKEEVGFSFIVEDLRKVIAESKEGTERVKKIVMDLKDFSHVDEEKLKYANINNGIESTLNIAWNELKYKTTVIKEYGEFPDIRCYPMELNQVFLNLLVNAAQAIEKKGEIRIKTYLKDGDVSIEISDTGCGIDQKHVSHVFDPFFTTKEVGKGTGLGLSMSYGIIQKHNGHIRVESEIGKGTTFFILLPGEGKQVIKVD